MVKIGKKDAIVSGESLISLAISFSLLPMITVNALPKWGAYSKVGTGSRQQVLKM